MNFQQLEYALALHHLGHFGRAAASCHVTQATLSGMLKKLEEELGYMLFDRTHQPIKTTEKGLRFLEKARNIIETKHQMYEINDTTQSLEGALSLGVIPTVASSLLPKILPQIRETHPKLKLEIHELTTENIVENLLNNKIDLGILVTPLEIEQLSEYVLYYESMLVYGVENSTTEYVNTGHLIDAKVWLLEEGHCFRDQSIEVCNIKPKQKEDDIVFNGSSFETLLNLTDAFGGITLVPELYANSMNEQRTSKTKMFNKPIPVREVSIVAYRPYAKQQSIHYLVECIQSVIAPILRTSKMQNKDMTVIGIR